MNVKITYSFRLLICFVISFFHLTNGICQLKADFSADKNSGCAPLAVRFTNQTTGASASAVYHWDFGNGNESPLLHPGAIFKNVQTYNVTLKVTDGGISSSSTKQIIVSGAPAADFTASSVKGCLPVSVNFTATSTVGTNTYSWDFGDGNILQGSAATVSHTYTAPQKTSVSLTVSNEYGCSKTILKAKLVDIRSALRASFNADKTILCRLTDAVKFSNNSFGPGSLNYAWDFGDGTRSVLATPSHVFNKKGTYTVKLTANSAEGCSDSSVQNGFINIANFANNFSVPAVVCNGPIVSFTNTSTPVPLQSEWLVDGIPTPALNPNDLDYAFTLNGEHSIELRNNFGDCSDSVLKKIIVYPVPDLQGFTASATGKCGAPASYHFKDTTAGDVKWEWDFTHTSAEEILSTEQSPTFTYSMDGDYTVWLRTTNAAGCIATVTKYVGIASPFVHISADGDPHPCGSFSKKFSATSTDSIVSYKWSFGDGTSSAAAQPTHLFNTPGNYGITLEYATAGGCKGTASYGNISVYAKPVANFTASATTICGSGQVSFLADYQGPGVYYSWDFGDNASTYSFNDPAMKHQYNYDSIYTVKLTVTTLGYCSDSLVKNAYIRVLAPLPKITSTNNTCSGNRGLVTFTQSSPKTNQLTWNFGDGTSLVTDSTQKVVTHEYNETKQYQVKLNAVNGQCSVNDSLYTYVHLKQLPVLSVEKTGVCASDVLKVTITHYENNPLLDRVTQNYTMSYMYGDNTPFTGTVQNDTYDYIWSNEFKGTLTLLDKNKRDLRVITTSYGFGCTDTSNFIPLIVKGSTAEFEITADNKCFKVPVVLKDQSKTNATIKTWQWDFGDGSLTIADHGGTTNHVYANPGTYQVVLTIIDSTGCSSVSNAQYRNVVVNGPKAAFNSSVTNTVITLPVQFYNNTNTFNSSNTQYRWAFGDNAATAEFSPVHSYASPGQYTVKLIANDAGTGCADTTSQVIFINNFNPAFAINTSFLTTNNCPPVLVRLSNNSVNYTSVKWDFGDGNTADNLNTPAHIYEKPGKYIITLYVYGPGGLTGTFFDSVTIAQPSAIIAADKKLGCTGLITTIKAIIKNSEEYVWYTGDGSVFSNDDSVLIHQYDIPGVYKPWLILKDSNGCNTYVALPDSITIRKDPVVTIVPASPLICAGQSAVLTASGGLSYTWSPAAGLSDALVASPKANPAVTSSYSVLVKDDAGCTGKGNVQVTVVQKTVVKIATDTSVCMGNQLRLAATGADNYQWIFTTTGLSDTRIPDPVATPAINSNYTVRGSDKYNCFSDTASIKVRVLSLPVVSIPAIPEVLLGKPVQITSISGNDVVEWKWSPADYLSCTGCPFPVSTPLSAINYKLFVKNRDGCTASAEVNLKLQCQESRVFIPAAFSPNSDGVNDAFGIKGISMIRHMIIYSRWGKTVFERSNYLAADRSNEWDGNFRGEPLPAGAYTFFAEMECPAGGSFIRKGTVILVR